MAVIVVSDADKEAFRQWYEGLPSTRDRMAVQYAQLRKDERGRYLYPPYSTMTPDEVARWRAEIGV